MKITAEDTQPPLYSDMNNKAYVKDRTKIDPYGPYMVGTVSTMKGIEPYPDGASSDTVYRGVKADLSDEYPKGREFTW